MDAIDWLACTGEEGARGARASAMAHRPKRTFRQRRAQSSDSDGAEEPFAEPGAPEEQTAPGLTEEGPPSGGGRVEVTARRGRGPGPRGRGRVWASSRRPAGAAPRAEGGSSAPGEAGRGGAGGDARWGGGRLGFSRGSCDPLLTASSRGDNEQNSPPSRPRFAVCKSMLGVGGGGEDQKESCVVCGSSVFAPSGELSPFVALVHYLLFVKNVIRHRSSKKIPSTFR